MNGTNVSAKPWSISIIRYRNTDLDIVGSRSSLELSFGFEHVFDAGSGVGLDDAFDPYERFDCSIEAVAHEFELSIRWNVAVSAIVLEAGQAYALVELDVFHLDSFASSGASSSFEHDLIVETQA